MTTLVSEYLAEIREMIDEPVASRWSDMSLRRGINNALKDIARTTHHIRDRITVTMVANQAEYTIPENVLEIEDGWYLPGDGQYIPLVARQFEGMNAVWGSRQNQTGGYPQLFTVWGSSPNLKLRLYPVPSVNGHTVSLMIVRYPTLIDINGANDGSNIDFPDAWSEAIVAYCEYRALRQDRDGRWQEAYARYQEIRDQLVVIGDYLNANRDIVPDPYTTVGGVPRWLASFD